MIIHIVTLFPAMFSGPFGESIVKRGQEAGAVEIRLHNLREFTHDRHRIVDDTPYGGAAGMVLKAPPFFEAVEAIQADIRQRRGPAAAEQSPVILFTPTGRRFIHQVAEELAAQEELVLLCGHYGGVDFRVEQHLATKTLSIGDYVLTGGELPAMVVVDAVVRLLPGVLHDIESARDDSFTSGLLQHPQYTRPSDFRSLPVPEVLLSGNHREVARWRRRQALLLTHRRRPDLLELADLTPSEQSLLKTMGWESSREESNVGS